jgi:hypothetical protein
MKYGYGRVSTDEPTSGPISSILGRYRPGDDAFPPEVPSEIVSLRRRRLAGDVGLHSGVPLLVRSWDVVVGH